MDHAEIVAILKGHFTEALQKAKARINTDGQLPKENIASINKHLEELDALIEHECDDVLELLGMEAETPEESMVHQDLRPILEKYELELEPESKEYQMMKDAYKFARRNYFRDLLKYNQHVTDFSMLDPHSVSDGKQHRVNKPEYQLKNVIKRYMEEEETKGIEDATLQDKRSCLQYLPDLLGEKFLINRLDAERARHVRECLFKTPKSRNTKKATKGLQLSEQLIVADREKLDLMSNRNIEKYITYFKSFMHWTTALKYTEENPFIDMKVPNKKIENRYQHFTKNQIVRVLEEVDKQGLGLAKSDSTYWGTLIAIYTGARRNEIASLLPTDILQDEDSGIWYFNITDEEESKKIKTIAAKRIVPLHSALLERGFLEYVEQAKTFQASTKHKGKTPRLLYDMTYHKKEKWGRNLGRFVNDKLLPSLGLKTPKHVLHSFRHSFITYLSVAGVQTENIKSMAGHEQGTVTFGIYTHYGVEHLPQFKKAIEELKY